MRLPSVPKLLSIFVVLLASLKALDFVKESYLSRFYVFDPQELQKIVKTSLNSLDIDASAQQVMQRVHENLQKRYPDYVKNYTNDDWVFNNAGNAMGTMVVLHASITEYLIFFGTAIGTEGHTGTHMADDYFTILYGEQTAALPYASKPERYLPGDQHHMAYGVNKQYSMPSGSFALELAQGYIPSMLPFGMIEVLTSTLDVGTFVKTAKISAKEMLGNIFRGKL